jgi:Syntaxin
MVTTLTRKFVDEMKLYQQAQQTYKSDLKNKVKRQVLVVKPDATDEEGTNVSAGSIVTVVWFHFVCPHRCFPRCYIKQWTPS